MDHAADLRHAAGVEESRYLDAVFTPGARLGTRPDDPTTFVEVVEVREVTRIRVPSGRLIVDSPWPEECDAEMRPRAGRELAERIPPGTCRVEASWTQAPYEFMGEQYDGRDVAAVRLCVADSPVARWEMALGVGEDPETVPPGERIGFHCETNMGSFADAGSWPALTAPFRDFWRSDWDGDPRPRATESFFDYAFERSSDERHGADLVTFAAPGPAVVWLGRTATGALAAVVVANGYHSVDRIPAP
ncbi:DUF4241 domain-containing protein [Kitasatospora sp. NPDC048365]|uniref:DUF4241 domain-containing protein n=1 Tax=Kitasatospora sp. NPDC048365 TaxID=3364050 RepID=UPI003722F53E